MCFGVCLAVPYGHSGRTLGTPTPARNAFRPTISVRRRVTTVLSGRVSPSKSCLPHVSHGVCHVGSVLHLPPSPNALSTASWTRTPVCRSSFCVRFGPWPSHPPAGVPPRDLARAERASLGVVFACCCFHRRLGWPC